MKAVADLRQRCALLTTAWLLTLAVAVTAVLVPWFLRVLDVDMVRMGRVAFIYAVFHALAAAGARRLPSERAMLLAFAVLQATGLMALGVLWHYAGGVENPSFLLVMALPVAASAVLVAPWQALGSAVGSVLVAYAVALAESVALRWYLVQLGLPVGRVAEVLLGGVGSGPLAGQPDALFVMLALFAAVQIAAAALPAWLAGHARRLEARLTPDTGESGTGLLRAALTESQVPTVVVFADTLTVVLASSSFVRNMMRHGEDLTGVSLFDIVTFGDPESVHRLLATGGEIPYCSYHVGPEPRVARIQAHLIEHTGESYAQVSLHDLTDLAYLHAAMDALEEPLLILGPDDRLRFANRAAASVFGEWHFGMEAEQALASPGAPQAWWREASLRDGGQGLQIGEGLWATSTMLREAHGFEPLTLVRLRRVASA